jgi:hypothetical protein
MKINLDFGGVVMPGRLFDTEIGRRLFGQLPVRVSLQSWGMREIGDYFGLHYSRVCQIINNSRLKT